MQQQDRPSNAPPSGAAAARRQQSSRPPTRTTKHASNAESVCGVISDCAKSELGEDSVLFHGASSKSDKRDLCRVDDLDNESTLSNYAFSDLGDGDSAPANAAAAFQSTIGDYEYAAALQEKEFAALDDSRSRMSLYTDGDDYDSLTISLTLTEVELGRRRRRRCQGSLNSHTSSNNNTDFGSLSISLTPTELELARMRHVMEFPSSNIGSDNNNTGTTSDIKDNNTEKPAAKKRIIDVDDLNWNDDVSGNDSELSDLELRILAGQAKAAEAQIDSPLTRPDRASVKRNASLQDVLQEVYVPEDSSKEQRGHSSSAQEATTTEASAEQRKIVARRSTDSRRSSCRQSKLLLASQAPHMSQSSNAILAAAPTKETATANTGTRFSLPSSSAENNNKKRSSGGASQRTLPTIRTGRSSNSRKSAKSARTTGNIKQRSPSLLWNGSSRGKEHAVPHMPSGNKKAATSTNARDQQPEQSFTTIRDSLLGCLYNSNSQHSLAKEITERGDTERLTSSADHDDSDDDILREAFDYDARRSSRKLAQPQDDEDHKANGSIASTKRGNSSRKSLSLSLSDAFSFRKPFSSSRPKTNNKKKGDNLNPAKGGGTKRGTSRKMTKEDKPIAPPTTRGTHSGRASVQRASQQDDYKTSQKASSSRKGRPNLLLTQSQAAGLGQGRSVRTMITRGDETNPRSVLFENPTSLRSISTEVWERRGSF